MSLGKIGTVRCQRCIGKGFQFRLSDDESIQYSHSAAVLGVSLPWSFSMKIVTFSELPDALYFAVSERKPLKYRGMG